MELCRRDDRSVGQIAKNFDLTETAVRDWARQAEVDADYVRRTGTPGPRAVRDAELTEQVATIHTRSCGIYGAPRVHAVLQRDGAACGRRRVARLMRAAG